MGEVCRQSMTCRLRSWKRGKVCRWVSLLQWYNLISGDSYRKVLKSVPWRMLQRRVHFHQKNTPPGSFCSVFTATCLIWDCKSTTSSLWGQGFGCQQLHPVGSPLRCTKRGDFFFFDALMSTLTPGCDSRKALRWEKESQKMTLLTKDYVVMINSHYSVIQNSFTTQNRKYWLRALTNPKTIWRFCFFFFFLNNKN